MRNEIKKFVEEKAFVSKDENVTVHELWENRYRCNVWQSDPNKIVKSYFVVTNESGIVRTDPKIGA